MEPTLVRPGVALVVVAVVLVLLAMGVARLAGLPTASATATAATRAALQLTAVALLIGVVTAGVGSAFGFVAAMLAVATTTASRRLPEARWWWAMLAIAAGGVPVVALVLVGRVVPYEGPSVVAVSGIVLGGAMTATAQAGKGALEQLRGRRGEYEAGLALGLPARTAGLELCRSAGVHALIPALDQTRTVGLVTLPGAFIGVLLSGGSATEAAAAQVLVLAALLAAETIAVAIIVELVVRAGPARPSTST